MAEVAATGAVFGAALVASGVYQPSVILSQLKWDNYHMLQAFLTATAASSIITTAAQKIGYAKFPPRQYAGRGWFAPYDGNIVGGLALGAGMALCGACPGTVLAQTALNIRSGFYALGGGFIGGTAWAAVLRPSIAKKTAATKADVADGKAAAPKQLPTNIQGLLGLSNDATFVGVELTLATIVGATVLLFGSGPDAKISPVLGGLAIGFAQLCSVVLRKSLLGVSTLYEDFGDWLLYSTSSSSSSSSSTAKNTPAINSIIFSLGIVAGAKAITLAVPSLGLTPASIAATESISPAMAMVGGFTMALGSRIAGGCTSGHGMSGMALFSVSSYITMAMAFVGGGIVAAFL
ncbi:hypothetical protein F503_04977 [Ophiostoma piceae UAMH 11346]|uniref:Uncharacterized protein n=1 Tax=Ophiostoma piceae (strain UAMH 11346) TaxID=1262450 RepID=S3CAH4_OPHP1|nr:hypothetical protein F503_04977 [Ophiostoma piceae UAMH 11346]